MKSINIFPVSIIIGWLLLLLEPLMTHHCCSMPWKVVGIAYRCQGSAAEVTFLTMKLQTLSRKVASLTCRRVCRVLLHQT